MAGDVVKRDDAVPPAVPQKKKPLDAYIQLLADFEEARTSAAFWEKRKKQLQAKLQEVMGDAHVGTVNDEEVVFYTPTQGFRGADFEKAYPNIYQMYCRDMSERRLDLKWLEDERPDLFAEFQSRPLRSTWSSSS